MSYILFIMSSSEVETNTSTIVVPSEGLECLGCVKWFNTKSGYGFVSVVNTDLKGEDIFTHHSSISVKQEQYKYLVQGEYVNILVLPSESKDYKWQAKSVSGVCNGPLMCETRNQQRSSRNDYLRSKKNQDSGEQEI